MGISKWNAGIIRPVPVAPTGSYSTDSAPGVWTLDQQAYWQKQGVWPTAGNVPNYIEDVFSTYLYTGNGSTQTITNGIDLAGKGGLVWIKDRTDTPFHVLTDTTRGVNSQLYTNSTANANSNTSGVTAFNSNGFNIGSWTFVNTASDNLVSWTFREQPKFFDVVTYTGTGANRTIAHNLGSVPGCIIVKRTDTTAAWAVYHRSLANTQYLVLNTTAAAATGATWWNSTTPTSAVFSVGTDASVNASGGTYVAYIYAHDAGGFGLTGTDNVISCGSYTGTGADNNAITLGFEPQFLMIKRATGGVGDWLMSDVMRGIATPTAYDTPATVYSLSANTSAAEAFAFTFGVTSTGFNLRESNSQLNASGDTYIYIAIRRGPMAVPTLGTTVYNPTATTATTGTVITTSFPVDAQIIQYRTPAGGNVLWQDRLRGVNTTTTEANNPVLTSNDASAEQNTFSTTRYWDNTGYQISANLTGQNRIYWNFRRAPGFFDVVCYTGTGVVGRQVTHNLSVAPEMYIVKVRNAAGENWESYWASLGNTKSIYIQATNAATTSSVWNNTSPTSSYFVVGATGNLGPVNFSGYTYVAYLFATCPGVSKVGSYTGTGALQTVACGFTSGARFVLIKRTDSTGDWYVWDSARGITSGNDPYLLLNSTAAEVTGTNYVDTDTTGFKVTAAAPAALNAVGGNYIFLAIA